MAAFGSQRRHSVEPGRGLKRGTGLDYGFLTQPVVWEIDAEQPHLERLPWLTRIRHFGGTRRLPARLDRILAEFPFTTLATLYSSVS